MVPIKWKFPTKPWFLRGSLILEGRDYFMENKGTCGKPTKPQTLNLPFGDDFYNPSIVVLGNIPPYMGNVVI